MDERALKVIDDFIIDLVNTRKFLQFYPSNNSRVRESLVRIYRNFRHLVEGGDHQPPLASDGLTFRVERKTLYYGPHEAGHGFNPVSRFATDLYRLGVKTFHIQPQATRSDIHRFLEASCVKLAAVRGEGGFDRVLAEANVQGISITFPERLSISAEGEAESLPNGDGGLDMLAYLRGAQAVRRPDDPDDVGMSSDAEDLADLSELTKFFSDVMAGSEEKLSFFKETLSDPDRLREALEHIHELDAAQSTRSISGRSIEVMRKTFGQMLANIRAFPPELREEFIRNIGMAIVGSPAEVQSSLVQKGLAAEVGNNEVADAVLSVMPDADVADALLHSVRFHQGTSNTISNFLDEYATDPRRRAAIARMMTRLSSDDDSEAIGEVVDLLRTAEDSHDDAPLAERNHQSGLDVDQTSRQSVSRLMDLEAEEIDQIEAVVETDFHLRTPYHAARTLLELYVQPTIEGVSKQTSERLHQQLLEIIDDGGYDYLAEILRVVEREMPEATQARVMPEIDRALADCCYPHHINRIFSRMRKAGARTYDYAQMLYLLDRLGERVIEHLFLRLEMEHSRSMRMFFLDLFRALGDKAIPLLSRKMYHRDWFVVRNVVYIFGSLETEDAVQSLILLLDHDDMRVRREVVRALAKIGGPPSEEALLHLLDDDEPAMRRIAAEWLGFMGCQRALPELRERLSRTAQGSHDPDTLIGLVRALGRLGEPEDAALIRRVAPRLVLFGGEKKRELSQAGKEALARLHKHPEPAGV